MGTYQPFLSCSLLLPSALFQLVRCPRALRTDQQARQPTWMYLNTASARQSNTSALSQIWAARWLYESLFWSSTAWLQERKGAGQ